MSTQRIQARFNHSVPWLGTGAAVSLLLHLSLGAVLVTTAEARLDPLTPTMTDGELAHNTRPRLGVEESSIASINWLGFADPTDHASLNAFDLDQAALTRETAAPIDAEAEPTPPSPPAGEVTDPNESEATDPPNAQPEASDTEAIKDQPQPEQAQASDPDSPVVIESPSESVEVNQPSKPEDSTAEEQGAQSNTQAKPGTPVEPQPQPTSTSVPNPAAIPDDREAAPAAREITLSLDRLGKPAAGEGIEIHTVRLNSRDKALRFLAGSLRNPVVLIEFGYSKAEPSSVTNADYEREKLPNGTVNIRSTGNPDIDRILRLNIYRWTATGKAIDELEPGQTLEIRLSIELR